MKKLLIKNGIVILDHEHYDNVHLVIENGLIADILKELPITFDEFDQVIDVKNKIVAPGLINGHTHSYANYFKTTADNLPLDDVLYCSRR